MTLLDTGWTENKLRGAPQPESRRWNSQVETGTPPKATILVLSSRKGPNLPRWATWVRRL